MPDVKIKQLKSSVKNQTTILILWIL